MSPMNAKRVRTGLKLIHKTVMSSSSRPLPALSTATRRFRTISIKKKNDSVMDARLLGEAWMVISTIMAFKVLASKRLAERLTE